MNARPTVNEEREEHKRLRELNAALLKELAEVLEVVIARGETLGFVIADDSWRERLAAIKKAGG